jgi:hypothetical protein
MENSREEGSPRNLGRRSRGKERAFKPVDEVLSRLAGLEKLFPSLAG